MKDLHENSDDSYSQQRKTGRTEHFRKVIFELLSSVRQPMTDREIMEALNEPDVNNIRPEITRLKQDELVAEVDKVNCRRTGKKVRRTVINSTVYFPRSYCRPL